MSRPGFTSSQSVSVHSPNWEQQCYKLFSFSLPHAVGIIPGFVFFLFGLFFFKPGTSSGAAPLEARCHFEERRIGCHKKAVGADQDGTAEGGKNPSPKTNSTCVPPMKIAEHKLFSVGFRSHISEEKPSIYLTGTLSSKQNPPFYPSVYVLGEQRVLRGGVFAFVLGKTKNKSPE